MLPITTPRLRLRRFALADAPAIRALNAEPSTGRWLPSHIYPTLDDAVQAVQFLAACCDAPGDPRRAPYVLAVDELATGELLGHVGFSPLGDGVEVSYAIAEAARGRGFGSEALRHASRSVADAFGLPAIVALTAADNAPSRRTLERSMFLHERDEHRRFQCVSQLVSCYRLDLAVGERA